MIGPLKPVAVAFQRHAESPTWQRLVAIVLIGLFAAQLARIFFDNYDLRELHWLVAAGLLAIAIWGRPLRQPSLAPVRWLAAGALCWTLWRFADWIFVSRSGLVIGLMAIATYPIQERLGSRVPPAELALWGLATLALFLSALGNYWVFRHFDRRWLKKGWLAWGLLVALAVGVSVYSNQPHVIENCFGVSALSSGLTCSLRAKLGSSLWLWVTFSFLLWVITLGLRQARSNPLTAQFWLAAIQPVCMALVFEPTRIVGVVFLRVVRVSDFDPQLTQTLYASMAVLNLIPIISFLLAIPLGLLLWQSHRRRVWWVMTASASTYLVLLGLLFATLNGTMSVFAYPPADYVFFGLTALYSWLPVVIVSVVGRGPGLPDQPAPIPATQVSTN